MSEIIYWLIQKWNPIRECQYGRLGLDGEMETTENPKRAMRWFNQNDAQAWADALGWPWHAVKVEFEGTDLCQP